MSSFLLCQGDARALPFADASVDAVVCDPPYELGFMGKRWDASGVAFDPATWREALRVLKDGGRLLAFGGSRTHHRIWCAIEDAGFTIEDTIMWLYGSGFPKHKSKLKPAYEPICVARRGGVSELNIDACRIGDVSTMRGNRADIGYAGGLRAAGTGYTTGSGAGRWPANIALDEEAAAMLDEQSGDLVGGGPSTGRGRQFVTAYRSSPPNHRAPELNHPKGGGASRFFYTAKASRSEREHGLEGVPQMPADKAPTNPLGRETSLQKRGGDRQIRLANHHPTVKPLDLMRWLVRLVTREGDLVLDPFTGSGTTGVAAIMEGRNFAGIEMNADYLTIAQRRIQNAPLSLFGGGGRVTLRKKLEAIGPVAGRIRQVDTGYAGTRSPSGSCPRGRPQSERARKRVLQEGVMEAKTGTARMVVVFSPAGRLTHGVMVDSDRTFCGLDADMWQLDRSGTRPSCLRCRAEMEREP